MSKHGALKAWQNGRQGQALVERVAPGAKAHGTTKHRVDGTYRGKPLEVKATRTRVRHPAGTRPGRFSFERGQHAHLVKTGGRYALVQLAGKKSRVQLVPARTLPNPGTRRWGISYRKLLQRGKTLAGRARAALRGL